VGGPREPQSEATVRSTLQIRPLSGADWRDVGYFRIEARSVDSFNKHIAFTPDGKWLYFYNLDSAGKDTLFRASTTGGEPERVGDFPSHSMSGSMKISPDGRNIIVNAPDATTNSRETWLLEDFEPRAPAAR
jgi:Tol biopolymer transport system component